MMRLDGGVATVVRERMLPALTVAPDRHSLLRSLSDLPSREISRLLDRLIDSGMITESGTAEEPGWLNLLTTHADTREALGRRLDEVDLLVIGDEGETAGLRELQAQARIRVQRMSPQDALADDLTAAVVDRDLVICLVDPGWAALRARLNRACLDAGTPALFVSLEGSFGYVGPLVLPGEGPCYMCWRMRALACADDFEVAMAREEALDRAHASLGRPLLPGLREAAWAIVLRETLALTTSAMSPKLPGSVMVLDQLNGTTAMHPVIPRPDCPACRKKAPTPTDDTDESAGETDFTAIEARTVSDLCGLIRYLDVVPKPVEEPRQPFIVRAQLANVLFGQGEDAFITCSGKGLTVDAARNGAIGEALERYASLTWSPDRVVRARRAEVAQPTLDPEDLVLHRRADAERLGYAPYGPDTVLDWVPARSLVTGAEVWVPFQAATLTGSRWPRHELLFAPTSNGFAAGPTVPFAAERALLEVIERDAFCIAWAHRLATRPYDAATIPDADASAIAELYRRRGVDIEVHLLPTDGAAYVAMAVGWCDDSEPAAVVGLGSAQDPLSAARSAVLEVGQVRPALRARLQDPATRSRRAQLVADPALVSDLEDHDLLYSDPATAARGLAHLRTADPAPWEDLPPRGAGLADLVASVAAASGDVLVIDVTPADVAALGVRVVRGILPGFQPIDFGADRTRTGHPRLFAAPHRWGLRERVAEAGDLNPDPHPLA
ncbi:TOMM precursor leader peptide-binding protein [Microbacterium sp. BK668]|uniref:TOMM precursor leader peptide-binding protein n=1 Tax=Microbacterium sp. BK668 TaxID=2512118 RepID=UPI001061E2FA|nr:TOMM precursor leader peptide-binding protein [Microbacterium sp. BK668]